MVRHERYYIIDGYLRKLQNELIGFRGNENKPAIEILWLDNLEVTINSLQNNLKSLKKEIKENP